MSAVLMNPQNFKTADIGEVIDRKLRKFKSFAAMPQATLQLVANGLAELEKRHAAQKYPGVLHALKEDGLLK